MTARALLIGCGEPGIHAETERFVEGLGIARLERVLLPGGCWWLAEAATATSGAFRRVLLGEQIPVRDALVRFINDSGVERVILLAHQGCAWYRQRHPEESEGQLLKLAGGDMFTVRDELLRVGPDGLVVEGHVQIAAGERTGFRQLFPASAD